MPQDEDYTTYDDPWSALDDIDAQEEQEWDSEDDYADHLKIPKGARVC